MSGVVFPVVAAAVSLCAGMDADASAALVAPVAWVVTV
jgi:hypothetical protein